MFYSDEVIKDHRNRVVAKEYRDPIHWSEYPYKIPIENTKLPFRRPIITNNEGVARRQTWSQTHIKWSELHRLWSAKT